MDVHNLFVAHLHPAPMCQPLHLYTDLYSFKIPAPSFDSQINDLLQQKK